MIKKIKDMKKGFLRMAALVISIVSCLSVAALPTLAAPSFKYNFPKDAAAVSVRLDDVPVLEGEAAIINSTTYVPLRSFSELVGADSISWDQRSATATVKKGNTVIHVRDGGYYLEAAGRYFYTPERVLNIDNRLFVPVRPFASVFCLDLVWNGQTRTVELYRSSRTLTSGASFYNSEDLYWLSRIISAEAKGESLLGQIAVGNVVLNRRADSRYPNTVKGVIFDRKHGTQFSPVSYGTIYNPPTESAIIAAKICLEGYSVSNEILFFMNPRIATNNWISKNRPYAFTIGNHRFYK